jgi:hypothetical protein
MSGACRKSPDGPTDKPDDGSGNNGRSDAASNQKLSNFTAIGLILQRHLH